MPPGILQQEEDALPVGGQDAGVRRWEGLDIPGAGCLSGTWLQELSELKPFDFSRSVEESVIDFLTKNPVWWKDTDFAMFVPKDEQVYFFNLLIGKIF